MVISTDFNDPWNIVIGVLFISCWSNTLEQVIEILIGNWKLLEKSIGLKKFETKML